MHHNVAGGINKAANRRVEVGADTTVAIRCIAVPGEDGKAARSLHVGQTLCQHVGTILYDHVRDVWHWIAIAA